MGCRAYTIAVLLLLATPALAHGPAEWIQRGGYKNGLGELCCGERDCGYKVSGTIEEKTGGYAVDAIFMVTPVGGAHFTIHLKEFVPFSEATPSPTGEFWFCKWGGKRKCFFAPGGSS